MRKTVLLIFIILLCSIQGVQAQTDDMIAPDKIGDYFSWDMDMAEIKAMLENLSMSSSDFAWNDDQDGGFTANCFHDDGYYAYKFKVDQETQRLKEVRVAGAYYDMEKVRPEAKRLHDLYGLDEAEKLPDNIFSFPKESLDEWAAGANDKTICILGYKLEPDGPNYFGMIFLDFFDRSYFK